LQNLLQSMVQYMWLEVYTITVTDWFYHKWSNHSLSSWCTKLNALRHGTFLLLHFANKKEKKRSSSFHLYSLMRFFFSQVQLKTPSGLHR
jgi:hypothetical protein